MSTTQQPDFISKDLKEIQEMKESQCESSRQGVAASIELLHV